MNRRRTRDSLGLCGLTLLSTSLLLAGQPFAGTVLAGLGSARPFPGFDDSRGGDDFGRALTSAATIADDDAFAPEWARGWAEDPGSEPEPTPGLAIRGGPEAMTVSWPLSGAGWILEQTSHLNEVVQWTPLPSSHYQVSATSLWVSVAPAEANRFYRLHKPDAPLAPALTGHWRLDEGQGAVAQDFSGRGNALSLTNVAWAAGRVGAGALAFNGRAAGTGDSAAWVSNTGHRVLPPAGRPFSVCFWLNADALTTGWRGLAGTGTAGSNGWQVALHTAGPGTNYFVWAAGAGGSLSVTGRTLLLPGQWYRLTATHDGGAGSLYLNGDLLARGAGTVSNDEAPLYFGGGVGGRDAFLGRLDDLRVFTNALTAEEISLNGQWRFDENAGLLAADSGAFGNHGTLSSLAAWSAGRAGAAVSLSNGQVSIPNDGFVVLPPTGGPFSLSLWVNPRSLPTNWGELARCADGTNAGWRLALSAGGAGGGALRFWSTDTGGTLDLQTAVDLPLDQWTKLDLTFNGGTATLYVNGRKAHTDTGGLRGTTAPLRLGAAGGGGGFDGRLDELRLYNRERADWEIGPVAQVMWETVLLNTATNLELRGSGPRGKPLTYAIAEAFIPTNGTLTNFSGGPTVTYVAGARKGPDAFAYTVSDGEFTSPPTLVLVSVVEPHWLSPAGGSGEPLDGSTPEQAWPAGSAAALDAIWRTNRYYDAFFYAPGEYLTTGWKWIERNTAFPGCKHVGAGREGPLQTTLKLVDAWDAWGEGLIFHNDSTLLLADGFEVNDMVLDCNAAGNPKYARGEPVWIAIPLVTTGWVESVTLRWHEQFAGRWVFGRASEFTVCARVPTEGGGYVTNCIPVVSTGRVDTVLIRTNTDEVRVHLTLRAPGVGIYALSAIEVTGAAVSLPTATVAGGGGESRLDVTGTNYSMLRAVDGDKASVWASGPEEQVQILLPLAAGTSVSQLNLRWNCGAVSNLGVLGPAATYQIRARDPDSGQFYDVPFVRHARSTNGWQTNTFGPTGATNPVVTDQLLVLLTARDLGVDFYSLRELHLQHGWAQVSLRAPTARNTLPASGNNYSVLQLFDGVATTAWASYTQGQVGAVQLTGSNIKLRRLKVVGFGAKVFIECFPLSVTTPLPALPSRQAFGNVLVEDCVLTDPATNNGDGLTAVSVWGYEKHPLTNAVVRGCAVTGVRSRFTYSHGFAATHVENCRVEDCGEAVYFEPNAVLADSLGPVLIRSNQFVNVNYGLFLLFINGGQFDAIQFLNNEVVLTTANGWGFLACDACTPGPSGSIRSLTALHNIVRYAGWLPQPGRSEGGLTCSDVPNAVVGNNVIALGTTHALRVRTCPAGAVRPADPPEFCDLDPPPPPPPPPLPVCLDSLPPGYRRAWLNNRDLTNSLLQVRYNYYSVDGPASQQQWP